jgi:hypothetical protein
MGRVFRAVTLGHVRRSQAVPPWANLLQRASPYHADQRAGVEALSGDSTYDCAARIYRASLFSS